MAGGKSVKIAPEESSAKHVEAKIAPAKSVKIAPDTESSGSIAGLSEAAPSPLKKRQMTRQLTLNPARFRTDEPAGPMGVLVFELHNGRDLMIGDTNGLSDPYCLVRVHNAPQWRSKTIYKTLNPDWDQKHEFEGFLKDLILKPMKIYVYDRDLLKFNDPLGHVEVDLSELANDPKGGLTFTDEALRGVPNGTLSFRVRFKLKAVFSLFPGTPLHASAAQALRRRAPDDATLVETVRDRVLRALCAHIFNDLAVLWLINAVGWVLVVVVVFCALNLRLFGRLQMGDDGLKIWFNIAVKVMTGLFSYLNGVALPWRVSIAHHMFCSRRSCEPGRDFYGRETEALWFLLPVGRRKLIAVLLNLSAFFHFSNQATHIVWHSYEASMEEVTAIPVAATFGLSVLFGILAGIVQGNSEDKLIKESPEKFPPPISKAVKRVFQKWRSGEIRLRSVVAEFMFLSKAQKDQHFVAKGETAKETMRLDTTKDLVRGMSPAPSPRVESAEPLSIQEVAS